SERLLGHAFGQIARERYETRCHLDVAELAERFEHGSAGGSVDHGGEHVGARDLSASDRVRIESGAGEDRGCPCAAVRAPVLAHFLPATASARGNAASRAST